MKSRDKNKKNSSHRKCKFIMAPYNYPVYKRSNFIVPTGYASAWGTQKKRKVTTKTLLYNLKKRGYLSFKKKYGKGRKKKLTQKAIGFTYGTIIVRTLLKNKDVRETINKMKENDKTTWIKAFWKYLKTSAPKVVGEHVFKDTVEAHKSVHDGLVSAYDSLSETGKDWAETLTGASSSSGASSSAST
jgi:hypothetical protein